jgi:hypothetical protein
MCGESLSFCMQEVVVFLPNSADMRRKASAGLGLCVAMVPESYQHAEPIVTEHQESCLLSEFQSSIESYHDAL